MKNKIILASAIITAIVTGISSIYLFNNTDNKKPIANNTLSKNSSEEYAVSSYITEDMKANSQKGECSVMLAHEYTPEYMLQLADNIAIVKVISLDGASIEPNDIVGMTYGKMLINNSIVGNLKEGTVVEYSRPGGTFTMSQWETSQPAEANEKRAYLRSQSGNDEDTTKTYINLKLEDDIDIEAGKTYLAYLKYNIKSNKYEIIGLGLGLREVNIKQSKDKVTLTSLDISNLEIKNNKTNEYQSLNDYINNSIKNAK